MKFKKKIILFLINKKWDKDAIMKALVSLTGIFQMQKEKELIFPYKFLN